MAPIAPAVEAMSSSQINKDKCIQLLRERRFERLGIATHRCGFW
jgi:hypothetical protein